jgi:hypothetical protein
VVQSTGWEQLWFLPLPTLCLTILSAPASLGMLAACSGGVVFFFLTSEIARRDQLLPTGVLAVSFLVYTFFSVPVATKTLTSYLVKDQSVL